MNTKVIKKDGLSKKSSVAKKKSKGTNRAATLEHIINIIGLVEGQLDEFVQAEGVDVNMSGKERKRLISAGVRNNGFIDKAFDIAADYPQLMPRNFNLVEMNSMEQRFEQLRHLMYLLQGFQQVATTAFMMQADRSYRLALIIYDSLRGQARANVPGAKELFEALRSYFTHRRRVGNEPTEEELMRDVRSLMKGNKDGKIVIENVAPKTVGGVRKVVDEVNKSKRAVKESLKEEE